MATYSSTIQIETRGHNDVHDLTNRAEEALRRSGVQEGVMLVFTPAIEFESGAVDDLKKAIERLVPEKQHYAHDARWGDGNGFSHVRAALLGPSLSVPVTHGRLLLGTWQQIVLIDFDNRPRSRDVVFTVTGD
ncbi:MAG: secondary thiamine-phosphate synthase enzyme [Bacteroidetes bacterium]|nr:secondary thiamine-phosphate synthase enzyme [Bacteroidota bacterium]